MTTKDIKAWVVQKASITKPYGKVWSASVTIGGMDINGVGDTIEKAYNDLTLYINQNSYYSTELQKILNRKTSNQ